MPLSVFSLLPLSFLGSEPGTLESQMKATPPAAPISCFAAAAAMRLHSMLKTQTTFTVGAPQQGGAT